MTIVGYWWKVERCSCMLVNANLTHESCLTGLATKHKTDDNATLLLEYRWICHSYPNHAKPTIWTCLHWTHCIHWFIFTEALLQAIHMSALPVQMSGLSLLWKNSNRRLCVNFFQTTSVIAHSLCQAAKALSPSTMSLEPFTFLRCGILSKSQELCLPV